MDAIHTGSKQGAKSNTKSQKVKGKGLKIHQRRTFGLEGHLIFYSKREPHQKQVEPEVNADGTSTGTAQGRKGKIDNKGLGLEVRENLEVQARK